MICGAQFTRLATTETVICRREAGHSCAHHWEPTLRKRRRAPMISAKAPPRRKPGARKEPAMSPTQHQTQMQIPPGWHLEPRQGQPRADELPILRDRDGRVQAVLESWSPLGSTGGETLS